jgi:hypothetical protein
VDLVEVPVLVETNLIRRASIAVGWLTELASRPRLLSGEEVVDEATATSLHSRARKLRVGGVPATLDFDWARTVEWDGQPKRR